MITAVRDSLRSQSVIEIYAGLNFSEPVSDTKPLTLNETLNFLSQPAGKILHPLLQSTLYNPELEERIL